VPCVTYSFQVVIILDDENPLDHQVGECLESKEGLTSVHVRWGAQEGCQCYMPCTQSKCMLG
jgi:hypothetical protein